MPATDPDYLPVDPAQPVVDRATDVLETHDLVITFESATGDTVMGCMCGSWVDDGRIKYMRHVAEQLAAAGLLHP